MQPKNAIGVEQSGKRSKDVAHMIELENGETLRLMHSRWQKLYDDIWDDKVLALPPHSACNSTILRCQGYANAQQNLQ